MTRTTLAKIFCLILLVMLSTAGAISGAPSALAAATGGSGALGGGGGGFSGGGAPPPDEYLSNLYIWFLGFIGVAALFAIVFGAVLYMFSGANLTKADEGRRWITNAIWGIVLAAAAYLILFTINPDLAAGFNISAAVDKLINNADTQLPQPKCPPTGCP